MKIHFLRHGLTEANRLRVFSGRRDEPLAPEGEDQARAAAANLPAGVEAVYCSTLCRTRRTAELATESLGLPISAFSEICEIDVGDLTGKSMAEMSQICGHDVPAAYFSLGYDFSPWGGESASQVEARIAKFLDQVRREGREALVVAHGGVIRMVYKILDGALPAAESVTNASIHSFDL